MYIKSIFLFCGFSRLTYTLWVWRIHRVKKSLKGNSGENGLIIHLLWFQKYVSEFSDISQIYIVEISSFLCSQNFYFRGFSEADIFSTYIRRYSFFYTPNLWACCHWYDIQPTALAKIAYTKTFFLCAHCSWVIEKTKKLNMCQIHIYFWKYEEILETPNLKALCLFDI